MVTNEVINSFFSSQSNVHLVSEFKHIEEKGSSFFYGEFDLIVQSDRTFLIKTKVPHSYPLAEIKFTPVDIDGYPHQSLKGVLCLNTPLVLESDTFIAKPEVNLKEELDRLEKWLQEYVIDEKEDDNYEYPAKDVASRIQILFSENENSKISNRFTNAKKFGTFKYVVVKAKAKESTEMEFRRKKSFIKYIPCLLMAINIGNGKEDWSDYYKAKDQYKGVWVYIDKPPVIKRKQQMVSWKELMKIAPVGFKEHLLSYLANTEQTSHEEMSDIIIMVGYKIQSSNDNKEIHWDLVLLSKRRIIEMKKTNKLSIFPFRDEKIEWGHSINACYDRFFGRGKLCDTLTEAKILVIGCGAIGSNLVLSLVRGGIKNISLLDHDFIEPGNLCRAEYSLLDVLEKKPEALKQQIQRISPFINVDESEELNLNLSYICKEDVSYKEIIDLLTVYDFIFDCTADNRLCYLLDELDITAKIINLSITDNAEEFICIAGTRKIQRVKQKVFKKVLKKADIVPTFREGTGCWHPTFNASYVDIHTLVGMALKELNNRLKQNLSIDTFTISCDTKDISTSYKIDYPV